MDTIVQCNTKYHMPHEVSNLELVFELNEMLPVALSCNRDSNCKCERKENGKDEAKALALISGLLLLLELFEEKVFVFVC